MRVVTPRKRERQHMLGLFKKILSRSEAPQPAPPSRPAPAPAARAPLPPPKLRVPLARPEAAAATASSNPASTQAVVAESNEPASANGTVRVSLAAIAATL